MGRILIGRIRGPQGPIGETGPQGPRGETGPQGPLPPLTNNGLATVAGVSALDAAYGKTLTEKDADLQRQINTANSNLKQCNQLILIESGKTKAVLTPSQNHQEFLMYGVDNAAQVIGAIAYISKNDMRYSFKSFGVATITGSPNPNTGDFVVRCTEYSRLYVCSSIPFTFFTA